MPLKLESYISGANELKLLSNASISRQEEQLPIMPFYREIGNKVIIALHLFVLSVDSATALCS